MRVNNGLWLFKDRVTLNASWGRMWDMKELKPFDAYTNNWRIGYQCFSGSVRVWRLLLNITVWNMPFQRDYYPYK